MLWIALAVSMTRQARRLAWSTAIDAAIDVAADHAGRPGDAQRALVKMRSDLYDSIEQFAGFGKANLLASVRPLRRRSRADQSSRERIREGHSGAACRRRHKSTCDPRTAPSSPSCPPQERQHEEEHGALSMHPTRTITSRAAAGRMPDRRRDASRAAQEGGRPTPGATEGLQAPGSPRLHAARTAQGRAHPVREGAQGDRVAVRAQRQRDEGANEVWLADSRATYARRDATRTATRSPSEVAADGRRARRSASATTRRRSAARS